MKAYGPFIHPHLSFSLPLWAPAGTATRMETMLRRLREEGTANAWSRREEEVRAAWSGELWVVGGSSGSTKRETDSLILPLGLFLWLIRTCK